MCTIKKTVLAAPAALAGEIPAPAPGRGSRRRRLWELESQAHCPVLGVCLPIAVLRRLVDKALGGQAVASDYDLHCGAVTECRSRGPIAEAVQRELDRRYAPVLRQAARCKSPESLGQWWAEALHGQDIAGPFWATLTHPCCTPALARQVDGAVHMLQHQAGMAARVDSARFAAVMEENAVLARELAAIQQRATRQATEQASRLERQQGEAMRLRAELLGRDTQLAALREELQALEAVVPGLRSRAELARDCARLIDQRQELQRALLQAQHEAERQQHRVEEMARELALRDAAGVEGGSVAHGGAGPAEPAEADRIRGRAILCVGGRRASVPVYRQLVEQAGGRFLHHDGGQENAAARLDDTLAAADLVICQAGCVSHDAYWRVKDHCKRTGKKCVFAETPSGAGVKRALMALAGTGAAGEDRQPDQIPPTAAEVVQA